MKISRTQLPLLATALVCFLLYAAAAAAYTSFSSLSVFLNFFTDNAVLGIAAIGMTFVILSGGIDLSVGAMIGAVSILLAVLINSHHFHPAAAIPLALAGGILFGAAMGCLIQFYSLPPFLVTLAGMFLARGLGFVLRLESMPINHPLYQKIAELRLPISSHAALSFPAFVFVAVLLLAIGIAHWTPFGRYVYALGGSEPSALLMGLPVPQTKIAVYSLSGFCSALAGVVYTFYTSAGNPTAGTGLELDAIAAVVIGGTLLSGGVGQITGTLLGVLIFGIIQTSIMFQGTLSSWWTKIAIGALLLLFILLQKLVQGKRSLLARWFATRQS